MVASTSTGGAQSDASVQARRRLEDAMRFLESGNIADAQDAARDLLGAHPEYVAALCVLARSYLGDENFDAALPCFVRASMLAPDDPAILLGLAEVQFNLQARELALQTLERLFESGELGGTEPGAQLLLGRILEDERDYERACEHLAAAVKSGAGAGETLLLLGDCYAEAGDTRRAVTSFKNALDDVIPLLDRSRGLYELSRIADPGAAKELLHEVDSLAQEASGLEDDAERARFEAHLAFARGCALERMGRHEESWQACVEANAPFDAIYSQSYWMMSETDERMIERAAGWTYAGPPMSPVGDDVPISLFILGATRSGTTTLERLVGGLPGVTRGFENDLVHAAAAQTSTANGFLSLGYPGQLPMTLHREFTANYASRAAARARGARVLTTTHPGLAPDLGRIAETVPKAKVVFVERNVDDAAFRIFGKIYPERTNPFAYDVGQIYDYLEGYAGLVEAWTKCLGDLCMRVSYEDMISNPKDVLGKVSAFCGLGKPGGKLPNLYDDRGCAEPYRAWIEAAKI